MGSVRRNRRWTRLANGNGRTSRSTPNKDPCRLSSPYKAGLWRHRWLREMHWNISVPQSTREPSKTLNRSQENWPGKTPSIRRARQSLGTRSGKGLVRVRERIHGQSYPQISQTSHVVVLYIPTCAQLELPTPRAAPWPASHRWARRYQPRPSRVGGSFLESAEEAGSGGRVPPLRRSLSGKSCRVAVHRAAVRHDRNRTVPDGSARRPYGSMR